jgi:hypothetical protein
MSRWDWWGFAVATFLAWLVWEGLEQEARIRDREERERREKERINQIEEERERHHQERNRQLEQYRAKLHQKP